MIMLPSFFTGNSWTNTNLTSIGAGGNITPSQLWRINSFSKILWDLTIIADRPICHNHPDIVVVDKATNMGYFFDVIIPGDVRVKTKLLRSLISIQTFPIRSVVLFWKGLNHTQSSIYL